MNEKLIQECKVFAVASIELYRHLTERSNNPERNLSRQYLLTSTKIGADVTQENYKDALCSARCAKYWLGLLVQSLYVKKDDTLKLDVNLTHIIKELSSIKE